VQISDVRFTEPAFTELNEARGWYPRLSEALAQRFELAVDSARGLIAEGPDRWQQVDAGRRQIRVHGFPYFLIYRPDVRPIRIVAVAHTSREPGYWRDRVSDE
jgi:plasmid stabilization system protein ParE